MSDMSVKEAYKVLQAECGIEVGDKVKVVRSAPADMEYSYHDCSIIASYVGQIATIDAVVPDWIMIRTADDLCWNTPFFCLELVAKAKPKATYLPPPDVTFEKNGLTVRGTFISKDTIKRNLDL